MKKIIQIIITLFIIILLLITSILYVSLKSNKNENEKPSYTYYYNVTLSTSDNNSFELIIPIFVNEYNISIPLEDAQISGVCMIDIINTSYGLGMKIIGTGNISIVIKGHDDITNSSFSMRGNQNNSSINSIEEYWLFTNFSNKLNSGSLMVHGYVEKNPPGRGNLEGLLYEIFIDYNKHDYHFGWGKYIGEKERYME